MLFPSRSCTRAVSSGPPFRPSVVRRREALPWSFDLVFRIARGHIRVLRSLRHFFSPLLSLQYDHKMSSSSMRFLPSQATTLVPVPFDRGQRRKGVALGPQRLLDEGLAEQIQELGWDVDVKEEMKTMCDRVEDIDVKGGGDVDGEPA